MKKAIAVLLIASLCSALVSCGNSETTTSSESSSGSASTADQGNSSESSEQKMTEETEIVFAFPVSGTYTDEGIQMVEDGINEITVAEDNVRVSFEPILMSNYANQLGMMMAGGDQLDVITIFGTSYASMTSKNQLMNLDPYMDTYGQDIKEVLGEEFLKSMTTNGSVYGFPTNNGKAAVLNIILRTDVIEDNNISLDGLYQAATFEEYCDVLDELTSIFEQMSAAEPDMYCLASVDIQS